MKDGKKIASGYAGMTYKEYLKKYNDLVNDDMKDDYGYIVNLTKEEQELDSLMNNIREDLIGDKHVYAVRDSDDPPRIFPPMRPFYEVKDMIGADKLYGTFQRMPKGANLHIHTSSTLSADDFWKLLMDYDNQGDGAVVVNYNKDDKVRKIYKYTVFYLKNEIPTNYKRIKELSKEEQRELLSYLTISENSVNEEKYIWDEFDKIFQRVYHVLSIRKIYYEYYKRAFLKMIGDNTNHVELRFGPSILKESNDDELSEKAFVPDDPGKEKFESVELIYQAYQEAKKYAEGLKKSFSVRLIVTSSRGKKKSLEETIAGYKNDIDWVKCYRNTIMEDGEPFIVGYDLVSEEDRGWNTHDVSQAFFDDEKLVDVPFFFHDGESCWADNKNLFSAVTLGSVRIGHGVNLYHFPDVLEEVRHRNVTLEVCPISNQLLKYTQDLRIHPIAEYMKRGINCVICNDDPQIFNYNGLAYDFWEIYYSQLIGLGAIKRLVFNSIQFSMLGKHKQEKLDELNDEWNKFVKQEIKILSPKN
ncbi:hypothetical protein D6853_14310 [Butyrivibrio sp. X503]|uniref:hypothetical protein n=1 Tax=Butyrivibrio sp. X503 TaxID=2364878 RepID=UPI000EA8E9D9|nr:hypothetical protein [Butyrivibrio sp. X503]RKM54107.1 hypothetical protein D6853_14310 [Butyrivibrio sp. X503]